MSGNTSYRVVLPKQLLRAAHDKCKRDDLSLAQVLRRFLVAWVNESVRLPDPEPLKVKRKDKPIE